MTAPIQLFRSPFGGRVQWTRLPNDPLWQWEASASDASGNVIVQVFAHSLDAARELLEHAYREVLP